MNQLTKDQILAKNNAGGAAADKKYRQLFGHLESLYDAMEEYSQQQVELERQKVKGLLTALEEIKGMKLLPDETDCRYAYNRCWHIADKALTNYRFEGMTYGITVPVSSCEAGDHDIIPILGFENSIIGERCRKCGKEFK